MVPTGRFATSSSRPSVCSSRLDLSRVLATPAERSNRCSDWTKLVSPPGYLDLATFPDKDPINPWEAGILTCMVDEFQTPDGQHHGVKLECVTMMPSWKPSLDRRSGL